MLGGGAERRLNRVNREKSFWGGDTWAEIWVLKRTLTWKIWRVDAVGRKNVTCKRAWDREKMMCSRSEEKPIQLERRKLEGQGNKVRKTKRHNTLETTMMLCQVLLAWQSEGSLFRPLMGFHRHHYFSSLDGPTHGQPFKLEHSMKYDLGNLWLREATACCTRHRVTLQMLQFLCYNYCWTQLKAYYRASMCHGPVEAWTPARKRTIYLRCTPPHIKQVTSWP